MKAIAQEGATRLCFILSILLGMLAHEPIFAQRNLYPLYLEELKVKVLHSSSFRIELASIGAIHGSRCDWYPVIQDHSSYETVDDIMSLKQIDNGGCDEGEVAFADYRLTIDSNSIDIDYRDADYGDGNGAGTGYGSADLWVYYDYDTGYHYKDEAMTERIYGGITNWGDGRKSPATPRFPAIVKTNFKGGEVIVESTTRPSPDSTKIYADGGSHTLSVSSPQTGSHVSFVFFKWDDNVTAQSRNVTGALTNWGSIWTADFTAKPDAPTSLTFTGDIGDPVQLT